MRSKSAILLVLALGCGLVAAIGVTQVINKDAKTTVQSGAMRSIIVAAKDIAPGELITPQMVKVEPWPTEKAPEDSLGEISKVEGCRARDEIYEGEPIRERKLLGQGFTRSTAADYIPKGLRVVGVKVDMVSGAGLIQPGDRVDVLVHVMQNAQRGVPESRTQTILQDIKVFAVDDVFKPDTKGNEEDTIHAKVIQLLVTPPQAETLVLAQQLGKVQLTMRPPGNEELVATPGKTPQELLGKTEVGDRIMEGSTLPDGTNPSGPGGLLGLLNGMKPKKTPAAAAAPAVELSQFMWNMRILTGSDLSDVIMEESIDPSGEHMWRIGEGIMPPAPPMTPPVVSPQATDSGVEPQPEVSTPSQPVPVEPSE
ncbi:MAG TPA: Flp pilus assembly protein CpaB [Thermoguttaceae bacterium]|nr:Flp pilus assembly protein CpaB [Thermoguttaceae bacterium]